jgi:hypothetical protein
MTQEADDHIILPALFQNTHKIPVYQSGIFRNIVLKNIGKMKTCFFPKQNFHNQKYYSKNGSKKLRRGETIAIRGFISENVEFSSFNWFGHHEIDLYPKMANTPHF